MRKPIVKNDTDLSVGPCQLSFPSLFSRKKFDGDTGEGKYMCTLLIPREEKETLDAIRAAIDKAVAKGKAAKWGGKVPKNLALPLIDGETYDDEFFAPYFTLKAKSNQRPLVMNMKKEPITDEEEIYGGVWADVSISFFPYNAAGNNGVGVALRAVRKVKDDKPFGGSNRGDDFDDWADDEDSEDW